jgi:hypothetical protein
MKGPHLDDESLSAALDDVSGSPDDEAHLAGCPDCRARLGQLASIAEAVGAPVPARSPSEVDAAIRRALDAAPASGGPEPPAAPEPVGLARHRPVRRWVEAGAAVAAAAVLIAGVAVGLTRSGRSSHTAAAKSAAPAPRSGPPGALGPTAGAGSAGVAGAGVGSDLGNQSDPKELAALLTARIGEVPGPTKGPGSASSPTIAPSPSAPATTAAAVPSVGAESTCLSSAVRAAGLPAAPPGVVRLVASLRWRGQPALVFVFDRQPPATGRVGVVVATPGCTLLRRLPL